MAETRPPGHSMYLAFYGLAEKPFSITPDPRYLYLSGHHAEALAHLVYGIDEAGGFIQLTGEVGTGKTTIIRSLLARSHKSAEIALILNPRMNAPEFMLAICEELGIMVPDDAIGSVKELIDILNRHLLRVHADGRRVVLIVDEAQNLAPELLEQIRLLTNLETETQKLLQIILIGQPELRDLLARNDLRQLAQRITGRYHLDPLSRAESEGYVKHRLRIAGATSDLFTGAALRELYRVSGGVPRLINIISDRALLGGYSEDRHRIPAGMVRRAASEVFGRRSLPAWLPWCIGAGSLAVIAGGLWLALPLMRGPSSRAASPAPVVAAPVVAAPAAAVPTPAPVTAPATLTERLRAEAANTGMDGAWWRLFSQWKARYVAGSEDACTQALRQGLECLTQRGTIAQLRGYNRPAILDLVESGAPHHVVLAGLQDDDARLLLGDHLTTVPLGQLLALWQGDFVLLWKPQELDTRPLSLGMRGTAIRELRGRLERWQGHTPDPGGNDSYDESLQAMVREFQQTHGLGADGVAGVQTQMVLDAALAQPGTPVLTTTGGG
jgi:general secretion pathway protein A